MVGINEEILETAEGYLLSWSWIKEEVAFRVCLYPFEGKNMPTTRTRGHLTIIKLFSFRYIFLIKWSVPFVLIFLQLKYTSLCSCSVGIVFVSFV